MPVNLSIKNAPDELVERLRERARRNHRSLQGELMAIVEEAAGRGPRRTPREVLSEVRKLGLVTPSESVEIIRADRDGVAKWRGFFGPGPSTDEIMALTRGDD